MKTNALLSMREERSDTRWQSKETNRWGSGERFDEASARERIIEAAHFCYQRLGMISTSMADIAMQARVTRPTVYRYFKTRSDVMSAVLHRDLNNFWVQLERRLTEVQHFGDYLIEALAYTLCHGPNDVKARLLFDPKNLGYLEAALLNEVGAQKHPAFYYALRPGARPPVELTIAVEWFNRLMISYLSSPGPKDDEDRMRTLLTGLCPWSRAAWR